MKRILASVMVLLIAMTMFAGCTQKQQDGDQSQIQNKAIEDKYPIQLTDSFGRTIKIESEVMKVVSLAPNITEIIYALNKGDKLVGRTNFCDYPEQVSKVELVGNMDLPDIEKIATLEPDLVICSSITKKQIVDKLSELGIKVYATNNEQSFNGVYNEIKTVGTLLTADEQATSITSEMKIKLKAIKRIVSGVDKKPSVYYCVGYGKDGDFTPGEGTFIDEAITLAGGINVAKDAVNWAYSLEKLMEKNPEIVIISKYFDMKKGFIATNGYKDLDAVKNGKVYEFDNNMLDRVGPRMVDGVEELCRIIHPDLWK